MYLKIEDGIITYPIYNIRSEFPGVELPEILTNNNIPNGYFEVKIVEKPQVDIPNQLVENAPVWVSNHYEQSWSINYIINESLTIVDVQEKIKIQAQELLETFARERGYFNLLSACSYINSNIDSFRSDAALCIEKRDEMWMILTSIQTKIENNERDMVYDISEIIDELPSLVWE